VAKVVILVPTYNEAASTPLMIESLAGVLPGITNHQVEVLYIDDSSPDGTAEIVRSLSTKHKWLHLLVNPKKGGLGLAYATGMQYAMQEMGADWLMEFDADFQHPVADIPRLVAEIDHGYDYILGSRYIPGGSIPSSWGFSRQFLSIVGNIVARVTLILPHIHDVTGGFKLSRVQGFMDQFDFSTLLSKSFAYKIHLLFFMVQHGAKVKEVPFHFASRETGESKIIKNEMQETLKVIFLLQLHNPKMHKLFKFGTVGFGGYLVNASSLYLFTKVAWPGWLAWGVSTEAAIISNFTFNNLWTFKDQRISGLAKLFSKFFQFNLTSMGGLIIQVVVGIITDLLFGPGYRQLVLPLSIGFLVMPYNYLMYTLVIWKKKK